MPKTKNTEIIYTDQSRPVMKSIKSEFIDHKRMIEMLRYPPVNYCVQEWPCPCNGQCVSVFTIGHGFVVVLKNVSINVKVYVTQAFCVLCYFFNYTLLRPFRKRKKKQLCLHMYSNINLCIHT